MSKVEMVMPQMGESIAEATILKWLRNVGDSVKKDETILEISTDKVDSEIPAPATGVIVELKAVEGQTVAVKSIIAVIETDAAAAASAPKTNGVATDKEPPKRESATKKEAAKPAPQPAQPATAAAPSAPNPAASAAPNMHDAVAAGAAGEMPTHYGEKFFSPLVRSISAQEGISPVELASIPGSGAHGRVTKGDLANYMQHRGSAPAPRAGRGSGADLPAPGPRPEYGPDGLRVEQMDNMRKKIAEHMVRSKSTSAHVYSTCEIDVTNIARWREAKQNAFQAREGFKLSFTPFFLEAAVKALIQYPYINCSLDGDKIILKKNINLGCAVALGNTGLIVPVIKNADQLSLVGLARSLNDLAQRARSKQLQPDEVSGGTFTVTNPGVFGNIIGNPIINQPQVAILSLGAIKKRPWVVNDAIAIRDIVYLTLSYDHRIVDGSLGGQYLQYITRYLEGWNMDRDLF